MRTTILASLVSLCMPLACSAVVTPQTGACCNTVFNTCHISTKADCDNGNHVGDTVTTASTVFDGWWLGPHTTCTPNGCPATVPNPGPGITVPPDLGSCCDGMGNCYSFTTKTACGLINPGASVWNGAGVPCSAGGCASLDYKACCSAGGVCMLVVSAACDKSVFGVGVYWAGGGTCSPNPCPLGTDVTGPCCNGAAGCTVLTPLECFLSGGTFSSAANCAAVTCGGTAPEIGACCVNSLYCALLSPEQCGYQNGVWLGGTCSSLMVCPTPSDTPKACCLLGTCVLMVSAECSAYGGHVMAATACIVTTCDEYFEMGACCYTGSLGGMCSVVSKDQCLGNGYPTSNLGVFQGVGTTCSPFPTEPCVQQQLGACCGYSYRYGGITLVCTSCCATFLQDECVARAGAFLGMGVTCSPNPCD